MNVRIPASLRITVLLVMLGFAGTLSTVNLLYNAPRAERAAKIIRDLGLGDEAADVIQYMRTPNNGQASVALDLADQLAAMASKPRFASDPDALVGALQGNWAKAGVPDWLQQNLEGAVRDGTVAQAVAGQRDEDLAVY